MQRRNGIKTTQAQYDRDAALLLIAYQWSFPHKSHRWKKFEPKDAQRDVFYYVTSTEIAVVWQRVARNEQAPEQAEEELRMPAVQDQPF